jgi:membrane associated rhomboid family serine protease
MRCPQCFAILKLVKGPPARIGCVKCGGRWHSFRVFEDKVGVSAAEELLKVAKAAQPVGKVCPHCEKRMNPLRTAENKTPLDVCFFCESVWFDFMEFESFRTKRNHLGEAFNKMHESAKPVEVGPVRMEMFDTNPYSRYLEPMTYEEPIRDQPTIRGFPFITYAVALACLLFALKTRNNVAAVWSQYAFLGNGFSLDHVRRLFTSFFVHAGVAHMIGNMYLFCLIAGPAEDKSPVWEFLLVLFGGHIVGTLVESQVAEPGTFIAGASAGVFSVLAYYAILFPKSRFQMTGFLRDRRNFASDTYGDDKVIKYSVPIGFFLFAMIAQEVFYIYINDLGVAHAAHLAGAAVGLLMGYSRKSTY